MSLKPIRGKLWDDEDPESLLRAADIIRNALGSHCVTSPLMPSRQGGWHINVTIYLKKEKTSHE